MTTIDRAGVVGSAHELPVLREAPTNRRLPRRGFLLALGGVAGVLGSAYVQGWQRAAASEPGWQALTSGNSGERLTTLPVTVSAPYERHVIYSVPLPQLATGEALLALAEAELTNDLGYNVMVSSQLILATSETATVGSEISEANGFNITPDMHHGVVVKHGVFVAPGNYANRYVNLVAWAASTAAQPGAALAVEQDYGRLELLRLRGN